MDVFYACWFACIPICYCVPPNIEDMIREKMDEGVLMQPGEWLIFLGKNTLNGKTSKFKYRLKKEDFYFLDNCASELAVQSNNWVRGSEEQAVARTKRH